MFPNDHALSSANKLSSGVQVSAGQGVWKTTDHTDDTDGPGGESGLDGTTRLRQWARRAALLDAGLVTSE